MPALSDSTMFILELIAVAFGFAFIILIVRQNVWGWPAGIIQSLLSIVVFWHQGLKSESMLYVVYVVLGFWGWYHWGKPRKNASTPITNWPLINWVWAIFGGAVATVALGYFTEHQLGAKMALPDAASTVFALLATVLEIRKKLPAFVLWIAVNGFSIWLYASRDLLPYAGLMVVYFVLSIWGFQQWHKAWRSGASLT